MFKLTDHPKITEQISFESYPSTKKFLSCIQDLKGEVEVEVNQGGGGVATFKVDIFRISKFIVGGPGEPYCKIPIKRLKLLNKFLGTTINNSKTDFCKLEDKFLFLVDKEHYRIDIQLSIKAGLLMNCSQRPLGPALRRALDPQHLAQRLCMGVIIQIRKK